MLEFIVFLSGVMMGGAVGFGIGVLSMRRMAEPTRAQLPPLVEIVEVKSDWVDEVPIPSRSVPVFVRGAKVGEVVLE